MRPQTRTFTPTKESRMKMFLLVGLVRNPESGKLFPKPLCTVQASDVRDAALRLEGRPVDLDDEGRKVVSALYWPDMPSASFLAGPRTGVALAAALAASDGPGISPEDVRAFGDGSASLLKMFERLVIGQILSVG